MKKFAPPKLASGRSRTRTSIRVPEAMLERLRHDMTESGYNLRQRSLWINEALEALEKKDYVDLILEDFLYPGSNEKIPVTITPANAARVEAMEQRVEREEGTRPEIGAILRTAIIQRLMTQNGGVPSRDGETR